MVSTPESIAEATGLDIATAKKKVLAHAFTAERELRDALGEEEYDRRKGLTGDAAAIADLTKLIRAESLLALHYAAPFLNLRLSAQGGIIKTVGGLEGERTELLNNSVNTQDLERLQAEFRRQAYRVLGLGVGGEETSPFLLDAI